MLKEKRVFYQSVDGGWEEADVYIPGDEGTRTRMRARLDSTLGSGMARLGFLAVLSARCLVTY